MQDSIGEHRAQARDFLEKGWKYLAEGDLHQASEKGWGAAAHMAKAVALAHGWEYSRHAHFHHVMNRVADQVDADQLRRLRGVAEVLHVNFYDLQANLRPELVEGDLEDVERLLGILAPLTE